MTPKNRTGMTKRTCEICGRIQAEESGMIIFDTETPCEGLSITPDWEQRRYEIALALFVSPPYLSAEEAVMNADDLIKALKNRQ